LAGKPFTVVGDGSQTRDFIYVSDVVNAFIKAAESSISREILNVGSSNTYSVNQLVDLLSGSVVYVPKRPGEPDRTFADTRKIRKLLGWAPEVEFPDGVQTMLRNIEYWRNAPVWESSSIAEATRDWFRYLDQ
jgi:UDP-glucose 4-epimerase